MNKIYFVLMILFLSSCSDPNENKKVTVVETINEIENDTTINVSRKMFLYDIVFIFKDGFEIEPILTKNELSVKWYSSERQSLTLNDKLIILFENNKRIVLFNYNRKYHDESYFKLSMQNINDLSKYKVKKIQLSTDFNLK